MSGGSNYQHHHSWPSLIFGQMDADATEERWPARNCVILIVAGFYRLDRHIFSLVLLRSRYSPSRLKKLVLLACHSPVTALSLG